MNRNKILKESTDTIEVGVHHVWKYPEFVLIGKRSNESFIIATIICNAKKKVIGRSESVTISLIESVEINKVFTDRESGAQALLKEQLGDWDDFYTVSRYIKESQVPIDRKSFDMIKNRLLCDQIWINYILSQL